MAEFPEPTDEDIPETDLPPEEGDYLAFSDSVHAVESRTQYFAGGLENEDYSDCNLWLYTTTKYFNYLGLTVEQAKKFLDDLLQKAQKAKTVDGVNGQEWQYILSEQEDGLTSLLHLKNYYTNCGIELYVTTMLAALL